MPLSDKDILKCFEQGLSASNGFSCNRVRYDSLDWKKSFTCRGHAKIEQQKVKLHETCGEPCDYVCDSAQKLQRAVDTLVGYDRILKRMRGERE